MAQINLNHADTLADLAPLDLAPELYALLHAVDFSYERFIKAIHFEDGPGSVALYRTALAGYAFSWKEDGKPARGLEDKIMQWRVITA
jgi:hypothetical protein